MWLFLLIRLTGESPSTVQHVKIRTFGGNSCCCFQAWTKPYSNPNNLPVLGLNITKPVQSVFQRRNKTCTTCKTSDLFTWGLQCWFCLLQLQRGANPSQRKDKWVRTELINVTEHQQNKHSRISVDLNVKCSYKTKYLKELHKRSDEQIQFQWNSSSLFMSLSSLCHARGMIPDKLSADYKMGGPAQSTSARRRL